MTAKVIDRYCLGMSRKSSIAPVRWTPPPAPETRQPRRIDVQTVAVPGEGPEDTLIDADGSVLTGLVDGRILRVSADGTTIDVLADTGGRPLGLEWLPDGKVLICDANRGLLTLDQDDRIETLLGEIDGRPMRFCNNADVLPDGTIYFTDSSTRFGDRGVDGRPARTLRYRQPVPPHSRRRADPADHEPPVPQRRRAQQRPPDAVLRRDRELRTLQARPHRRRRRARTADRRSRACPTTSRAARTA